MTGVPPPPTLPRDCWASWFWDEVQADECAGDPGETPSQCEHITALIFGALEAGVIGHAVPVAGFAEPVPLHQLLAPYRRQPGGLADREDAARRRALERPVPRRAR